MANTYVDYTATAAQTDFAFSFPYLEDEHVTVEINGVATTDFTIVTTPSTKIVLDSGATAGQNVRVQRVSAPDENLVDFQNGSVLTESELDRAYLHNRYLAEESSEQNDISLRVKAGADGWEGLNKKLIDLADPVSAQDAATKNYVDTNDALKVSKSGDTMSGNLAMGGNKVTGLGTPTSGTDSANKTYVDDTVASVTAGTIPDGSISTAKLADDAVTAAKLDNTTVTPGSYTNTDITVDENGRITAASSGTSGAAGTVTSVATGTGLTGGPITTSGTISIDAGGVDTTELADGAVTTDKIDLRAVTFEKVQLVSNMTVLGNVSGGIASPSSVTILDEDAMGTNSATALATQQSIKAYVDSQTVSKYSTGWVNTDGTTSVGDGATLTFSHSLGTDSLNILVYTADNASGLNMMSLDYDTSSTSFDVGVQIKTVTTTQLTIQLGADGNSVFDTSGNRTYASLANKYIKVIAIG